MGRISLSPPHGTADQLHVPAASAADMWPAIGCLEQARAARTAAELAPPLRQAFAQATYRVPALRASSQAGLVNNLNDGLAWGLLPLFLAAHGASVAQVGLVASIYPGSGPWRKSRPAPGPMWSVASH